MGLLHAAPTELAKPGLWVLDPDLVDPDWQWVHDGLEAVWFAMEGSHGAELIGGYDAVPVGGATFSHATPYGENFDATSTENSKRLSIANHGDLFKGGTDKFTVLAVIAPNSAGQSNRGRILDAGSWGANGPFGLAVNNVEVTSGIALYVCRASDGARTRAVSSANAVVFDGTVQVIAASYNEPVSYARFYSGGKAQGSQNLTVYEDLKALTGSAHIGKRSDVYYGFDGPILLICKWGRALTAWQLKTLTQSPENAFAAFRMARRGGGFATEIDTAAKLMSMMNFVSRGNHITPLFVAD